MNATLAVAVVGCKGGAVQLRDNGADAAARRNLDAADGVDRASEGGGTWDANLDVDAEAGFDAGLEASECPEGGSDTDANACSEGGLGRTCGASVESMCPDAGTVCNWQSVWENPPCSLAQIPGDLTYYSCCDSEWLELPVPSTQFDDHPLDYFYDTASGKLFGAVQFCPSAFGDGNCCVVGPACLLPTYYSNYCQVIRRVHCP